MSTDGVELLRGRAPVVLLESRAPGPAGPRHLLARDPLAVLVAGRDGAVVAERGGTRVVHAPPLVALRRLRDELPPNGAVVGALAYEAARPPRPGEGPLLVAMAVPRLEPWPPVDAGASLGADLAAAAWAPWPREPPPSAVASDVPCDRYRLGECSSMTRDEHAALVARILDHIGHGDIYQANLAQRFQVRWPHGGVAVYEQLRRVSPTPFAGYLRIGPLEIASASPERLLLVDGGNVETRPIAGTRPRSSDATADARLRSELVLSEKERAEHLMLVDLSRNDLGRVAATGSVHVDELMAVEEYAHVRHIVSNVRARLRDGVDAVDALEAIFPGGTITGVPKRRCMEILDRLEPVRRGFYTGALFYLTAAGRLDANILIRSAVIRDGVATFHAGGGIVADSVAAREYEETLHKAEAVRAALAAAVRQAR